MRSLFILLISLVYLTKLIGQTNPSPTIKIAALSPEGMVLDKGWKFMPRDNPAYANPAYNDSNWQSIDPTSDVKASAELWKTNIGWFRFHLSLDSVVAKKSLSFFIQQTGASEIFLNGHLIAKFGKIAVNSNHVQAVSPVSGTFISLPKSADGEQVLAVRFAVQKGPFYINFAGRPNPAFVLRVIETKSISDNINSDNVVYFEFARVGLFLILSVLHLALFFFDPSKKANLYFFIYAFLTWIALLTGALVNRHGQLVSTKMLITTGCVVFYYLGWVFFLLAVYELFRRRFPLALWFIASVALSTIFLFGSSGNTFFWLMNTFSLLPLLEVIRVTFLAFKEKQRGATIVIFGAVMFVIFYLLFVVFALGYIPAGPNWIYGNFAFNISALSVPVAISIYLALESSYASRTLAQKLVEVQELSDQTRAQEQEKQQILASQKEKLEQQVKERTAQLSQSLQELKATQAQLIQSEKMASLGELTAGIAHEIQNPLNFVNNFSEVNTELIEELKSEKSKVKSERNEQVKDELLNEIAENEQKINHHGKRADAIVKGMLQHSRVSTGQKEPTDINALAEEYLRLSFHGLRAKDKSFNATIETHLDESTGKIEVIPQDIGRVLLNLFNNAFYAVSEKKKQLDGTFGAVVSVSTERSGDEVQIRVKDNGIGIPQKAVDKIFQPFFTTKPTGQGTGLGLSLSYDIIKAHGGELKVQTKEGEGAEFIVQLPLNENVK